MDLSTTLVFTHILEALLVQSSDFITLICFFLNLHPWRPQTYGTWKCDVQKEKEKRIDPKASILRFHVNVKPGGVHFLRKWSNLTCAYFSKGFGEKPPSRYFLIFFEPSFVLLFKNQFFQLKTPSHCKYLQPSISCYQLTWRWAPQKTTIPKPSKKKNQTPGHDLPQLYKVHLSFVTSEKNTEKIAQTKAAQWLPRAPAQPPMGAPVPLVSPAAHVPVVVSPAAKPVPVVVSPPVKPAPVPVVVSPAVKRFSVFYLGSRRCEGWE